MIFLTCWLEVCCVDVMVGLSLLLGYAISPESEEEEGTRLGGEAVVHSRNSQLPWPFEAAR